MGGWHIHSNRNILQAASGSPVRRHRQNEVQKRIREISASIAKKPKGGNVLKARDSLNRVLLDGSLGAHNYSKTMELLSGSSKSLGGK